MQPFLPREKMSKRNKRALDGKKRAGWDGINPITRKTENKKAYNRKKSPRWYNDYSTGIFVMDYSGSALSAPSGVTSVPTAASCFAMISFTTSPARMYPATGGTNDTLPGT